MRLSGKDLFGQKPRNQKTNNSMGLIDQKIMINFQSIFISFYKKNRI